MRQIRFAFPISALCLLAAPFLAEAQTTPVTCTVATLTGTHSLVLSGRDVLSTAALSKVSLSAGTATFDGAGNVTFNLTTNTNLTQGVAQVLSGTYTLPSNCLGTLSITTGDMASFTLIPYNQGKNFTITGGDATYGFTGSGGTQPAACLISTLSGQYVFSGNGWTVGSPAAITGVDNISGLLQFDGAGAITGSWSVVANGTATPDTITGHYSVSSCTASATVTDPHGVAYTLAFTLTSADGANFSVLGAGPGNLFSATGHSTFTNPGLAVELAAGSSLTTPPGSLFSIYGTGLSTGTNQATGFPLPTTLSSATVYVNGEKAPIYSLNNTALGTSGLINAQMPLDIQPGVATLFVMNGATLSNSVTITIPATAVPGVFVYGNNHAAARNFPDYSVNSSSAPAGVGDLVVVYFTGGGPVQNPSSLVTGQATPDALFSVAETYSATIGGVSTPVGYIGLVPTQVGGFYQANITIPSVAAGEHNLIITIGGKASNTTVISTK